MVVPIRDLGNKFFSNSATIMFTTRMSIAWFGNMDVDDVHGGSLDNFDDVRGLTKCPANDSSLDIMSVTNGSVDYAEHIEKNNDFVDKVVKPVDSSQLSYIMNNNQKIQSSRVAELSANTGPQCINNEELSHSNHENNNVFNIQLKYDIDQARDENFQAILLYGSLEHLALDIKNIKKSLTRMQKYILDKTIEGSEANNVKDLEGIDVKTIGSRLCFFLFSFSFLFSFLFIFHLFYF